MPSVYPSIVRPIELPKLHYPKVRVDETERRKGVKSSNKRGAERVAASMQTPSVEIIWGFSSLPSVGVATAGLRSAVRAASTVSEQTHCDCSSGGGGGNWRRRVATRRLDRAGGTSTKHRPPVSRATDAGIPRAFSSEACTRPGTSSSRNLLENLVAFVVFSSRSSRLNRIRKSIKPPDSNS